MAFGCTRLATFKKRVNGRIDYVSCIRRLAHACLHKFKKGYNPIYSGEQQQQRLPSSRPYQWFEPPCKPEINLLLRVVSNWNCRDSRKYIFMHSTFVATSFFTSVLVIIALVFPNPWKWLSSFFPRRVSSLVFRAYFVFGTCLSNARPPSLYLP